MPSEIDEQKRADHDSRHAPSTPPMIAPVSKVSAAPGTTRMRRYEPVDQSTEMPAAHVEQIVEQNHPIIRVRRRLTNIIRR
ncbi:hypothetical protein FIBSPDRAFT_863631 [Athelia psychrophila]|uniref:Uncharacterized protein n=1 Tax=Athelia psychrophila TaxID=1759441 RepID=A0A166H949_9AGAM|nr:hypothetical protein FIBSPDRAFT_863631 [Fibularhizoctonia sp. CBS 109695]